MKTGLQQQYELRMNELKQDLNNYVALSKTSAEQLTDLLNTNKALSEQNERLTTMNEQLVGRLNHVLGLNEQLNSTVEINRPAEPKLSPSQEQFKEKFAISQIEKTDKTQKTPERDDDLGLSL